MRVRFSLAAAALVVASAFVMESIGPNQNGHYALVRAFAAGHPYIHKGDTGDSVFRHGHYYARKAPGLAMFTFPWYEALRATGLDSRSRPPTAVWKLNLFGAVLPFAALLMLMRWAAERVVPGYGAPAAVFTGAGTLLLPFATLFFAHMLSATLGFAAFALLLRERRTTSVRLIAAAGLCCGLAVVVEYTLVIIAAVLGLAVLARRRRIARAVAYAVGFAIGIVPLLAFNVWAFRSPTELNYARGLAGNGAITGLYGAHLPQYRPFLSLLLSNKGLIVLTPLTLAAIAGAVPLWRAGQRWAASVCAGVPIVFLVWNAGYFTPFAGSTPGPRYLIPALPFLVVPLAAALRLRPLLVTALAVTSAAVMVLATATEPMTGDEGTGFWLHLVRQGAFMRTVLTPLGAGQGWLAILPFGVLVAVALGIAIAAPPSWRPGRPEAAAAIGAVAAWLVLALVAASLLPITEAAAGTKEGAFAMLAAAATAAVGVYLAARRGPLDLLPVVPLIVLAAPHMAAHPRWCLLLAVATLCVAVAAWFRLVPVAREAAA